MGPGRPITERQEQLGLGIGQGGPHPDERGGRADHHRVAVEAILAGDEHLVRMAPDQGRDSLERHDRVQRGDLDADHLRQLQDRVQGGVVVRHAAGGLVEIERDHGQLATEPPVVAEGVVALRKGKQRIGPPAPRLDRHGDVARTGDDDPVGQRLPPGLQHLASLLRAQVGTPPRVGPHRDTGDGMHGLTGREIEVLGLLAEGYRNDQIGAALFISPKTASVHVSRILAKLGVSSRGEAAAWAHRKGLFVDQA